MSNLINIQIFALMVIIIFIAVGICVLIQIIKNFNEQIEKLNKKIKWIQQEVENFNTISKAMEGREK